MTFTFRPAIREATPLLIGITSPSGGGKTRSALRLATGIQRVRGGNIIGIDTEAKRMLHYADQYKFQHLAFGAPFSSDRYAEAITAAVEAAQGGVVIVDSMSHEHEGAGGYLEYQSSELDRMAGDDWQKRQKMTFSAWIKPAAARRRLINTLLQLNSAFIFCFRAKEKLKIVKGQDPIPLGWQAIAGDEFVYEMTVRCLLLPGAMGVPDWSADSFKHGVPKREDTHIPMFQDGQALNEDTGEQLARWAAGAAIAPVDPQPYLDAIAAASGDDELKDVFSAAWKAVKSADGRASLTAAKDAKKAALTVAGI